MAKNRKHITFIAKKFHPNEVKFIRQFAYAFDDGSLNPENTTSKQEKQAIRKEQISRGYDVILTIIEKNPSFLKKVEDGIYEYARINNQPIYGTTVNELYPERGNQQGKYLSHMIKWNSADDIYFSPTAKSILFEDDSPYGNEFDSLHNDLRDMNMHQLALKEMFEQNDKIEPIKTAFVSGFRRSAIQQNDYDVNNKETMELLWDLGEQEFNKLLDEKPLSELLKLSETDHEHYGKTYYSNYLNNQNETNIKPYVSHSTSNYQQSQPYHKENQVTETKQLNINDAALAYANGWYDGAEKQLTPDVRKRYSEIIMQDGIDAFTERIKEPSKREKPLPDHLINYVGYDTYDFTKRTEDTIRFDGQLHYASLNDIQLFKELIEEKENQKQINIKPSQYIEKQPTQQTKINTPQTNIEQDYDPLEAILQEELRNIHNPSF